MAFRLALDDLSACCRLCLSKNAKMKSVFDDDRNELKLQQKITELLNVEVTNEDRFPTVICYTCWEKIKDWQLFKSRCAENQAKLEQLWTQKTSDPYLLSECVQIKDEPLDDDDVFNVQTDFDEIAVKAEEGLLPPPLSPALAPPILEQENNNNPPKVPPKMDRKTCPICGKKFTQASSCRRHQKTVHKNDLETPRVKSTFLYCCPDCKDIFNSTDWEKHKAIHKTEPKIVAKASKPQRKVVCQICDKEFSSTYLLKQHAILHETMPVLENSANPDTSKKITSCEACNKFYASRTGLLMHNKRHHPDLTVNPELPKTCKYCDRTFRTTPALLMHTRKHEREPRRYSQPPKLLPMEETPKKSEQRKSESLHSCKTCKKIFSSKQNLTNHEKVHLSPVTRNVTKVWCALCHISFNTVDELKKHTDAGHESAMPVLQEAENIVEPKKTAVFTCEICLKVFATNRMLKKHKREHEAMIEVKMNRNVFCKHCRVVFSSPQEFQNHMKREHDETQGRKKKSRNDKGKDPCKLCKKTFKSLKALHIHESWHRRKDAVKELKKFQCQKCDEFLATETGLKIHILEKHRIEEEKKRCPICFTVFSSLEAYAYHKKFHKTIDSLEEDLKSNFREFKCSQCGRTFDKEASLNIHLKVHEKHLNLGGSAVRSS